MLNIKLPNPREVQQEQQQQVAGDMMNPVDIQKNDDGSVDINFDPGAVNPGDDKGHFDKERMMPSLMDEAAYEAVQKEKFDANQPMFAGGGLTRTVAPDSGPMSRGLSYLYNRARRK